MTFGLPGPAGPIDMLVPSTHRRFASPVLPVVLGLLALLASGVHADTIWSVSGSGASIEMQGVQISNVTGDQIVFVGVGGVETNRPIESVARIEVPSEPALNTAEKALAAQQLPAAVDGYVKAIKASQTPWVRRWAGQRLLGIAPQAGKHNAIVTGYVAVALNDPKAATALRPQLPPDNKATLDAAAAELRTALAAKETPAESKRALLALMVDVQRLRGDRRAAADAIQQILDLGPIDTSDPQAARLLIRLKLDLATIAIEDGQHQKAIDELRASSALFTEPADQADALYAIAEAQRGLAEKSKDQQAMKDAALAYMRVVAHFKDLPGAPHVGQALLKTAQIHEAMNEPQTAIAIYGQLAAEHPQSDEAGAARASIQRLGGTAPDAAATQPAG